MTEMYPRIPWEQVVDPLGSVEHAFGTTALKLIFADLVKKKLLAFCGTRHLLPYSQSLLLVSALSHMKSVHTLMSHLCNFIYVMQLFKR